MKKFVISDTSSKSTKEEKFTLTSKNDDEHDITPEIQYDINLNNDNNKGLNDSDLSSTNMST